MMQPPKTFRRRLRRLFLFLALGAALAACATVPIIGRAQLSLVSDAVLSSAADQQFSQFMTLVHEKRALLSASESPEAARALEAVNRVSARLIDAAGLRGRASWETVVVKSPMRNAFVLPNGKIVIFTGLLSVAETDAGLAAIIGHEIGHVVARHAAERTSQVLLTQIALTAVDVVLAVKDSRHRPLVGAALGVGAIFGVHLPFSRFHELEADRLGLLYMAKAGYDPADAIGFWERMEARSGSDRWEFLSTHPSPSTRRAQLTDWLPDVKPYYVDQTRPLPSSLAEVRSRRLEAARVTPAAPAASLMPAAPARLDPDRPSRPAATGDHWILGVWEGSHRGMDPVHNAARFEFTRDAAGITWRMSRDPRIVGSGPYVHASGTVRNVSDSWAELEGTASAETVSYSLSRAGDRLDGYLLAGRLGTYSVSLKKVR